MEWKGAGRERWKGRNREGVKLMLGENYLTHLIVHITFKCNILPYISLSQEPLSFSPYMFIHIPILYEFHGP